MCGIVTWAGKTATKFNKAKFDLVGSYNEERGIDSCGVASDGYITVGIKNNKVYRDFIVNLGYDVPTEIPVVLGHTRKATFCRHNADNAHPFGFGSINETGSYEFIGVHNGSLLNHKELAEKYKIETNVSKTVDNVTTYREKIDSEVLLEIIYKTKSFKVLSEYNGAAALVFSNLNEPNVVYCWHGACKKNIDDTDGKIYEERPLFYYKETRNSLYISSMENSLEAIGGEIIKNEKEEYIGSIGQFKHNVLYKITDGNIATAETFKINRRNCYSVKSYKATVNNHNNNAYKQNAKQGSFFKMHHGCKIDEWDDEYYEEFNNDVPFVRQQQSLPFATIKQDIDIEKHNTEIYYNIYNEKPPINIEKSKVYFNKLRYWKDENLIRGCYVWIENFGFYFLGKDISEATKQFWFIVNKEFFQNDFCFTEQKFTKEDGAFIPFVHEEGVNEIIDVPLYYFYKGIRLKHPLDLSACINKEKSGTSWSWEHLSICAAHPIIDIDCSIKTASTQYILHGNKIVNDIICPLGSNKIYTIENGNCVWWQEVTKTKITNKVDNIEIIAQALEKHEDNIRKQETVTTAIVKKEENKDSDLLNNIIDEIFKHSFSKFPFDIKRLENYSNHEKAQEAMIILEQFLKDSRQLISLEKKE